MKTIFIDENLSPLLARPLAAVYRSGGVRFRTWQDMGQGGVDDLDLFPFLASADVDLIITKDYRQLENAAERAGLVEAGLSWMGVPESDGNGERLIGLQLGSVIPAVGVVLDAWPREPTAFQLCLPGPIEAMFPLRGSP